MSKTNHALLSASSAHRWLNCPPSARMEEQLAETESEYAREGTLAHAVAELKLRKYFMPMSQRSYTAAMNKLKKDTFYKPEMESCTDEYLEAVKELARSYKCEPHAAVEKRVDYSEYAPEGFGTADCVIIGGGDLAVVDYKHGQGVKVDVEENPQLMLYALGAEAAYRSMYMVKAVKLVIVQPRAGGVSEWACEMDALKRWGESVKTKAALAYEGGGDARTGDWCRFCKAYAICGLQAKEKLSLARQGFALPPILTNDEVGRILKEARDLKTWVCELERYALSECLKGGIIPGWKAVAGRSAREFTDVESALNALKNAGYDDAALYERKPLSLAQIEKLTGKKEFASLLGAYVQKPLGKPALAEEDDERPPYNETSAQQYFSNEVKVND